MMQLNFVHNATLHYTILHLNRCTRTQYNSKRRNTIQHNTKFHLAAIFTDHRRLSCVLYNMIFSVFVCTMQSTQASDLFLIHDTQRSTMSYRWKVPAQCVKSYRTCSNEDVYLDNVRAPSQFPIELNRLHTFALCVTWALLNMSIISGYLIIPLLDSKIRKTIYRFRNNF